MKRVAGFAVGSVITGIFLSDFIFEAGLSSLGSFLKERGVELKGVHTSILFSARPQICVKHLSVDLPEFAKLTAENVVVEFACRRDLFGLVWRETGETEQSVDVVNAEQVEICLTQNVFAQLVASGAIAGLSLPGAVLSSVVGVGSAIITGKEQEHEATSSSMTIRDLDLRDVRIRIFAGPVELPTTLRVPQVRVLKAKPTWFSVPMALVEVVTIIVQTAASSSVATVGNLIGVKI